MRIDIQSACGSCKTCRDRNDRDKAWFSKKPIFPREVWKIGGVNDSFKKYFSNDEGYHIEWDEDIFGGKNLRHLKETFKIFWENEVHKSIIVGETNPNLLKIFENEPWCALYNQSCSILSSGRLPSGPEIIWINEGDDLFSEDLTNYGGTERVFFIPKGLKDPDPLNRGEDFSERHYTISFANFYKDIAI